MEEIEIRLGDLATAMQMESWIFGNCHSAEEYVKRNPDIVLGYCNGELVSFLATYIRDGRIYIWLCGTVCKSIGGVSMRRRGFLSKMLKFILPTYSKEYVFVKTYPQYFREMYSWIQKMGFAYECDEVTAHSDRGPFCQFGIAKKDLLAKL